MENGDTKRSRRVWRKGGTGNLTFSYLGKDDGGGGPPRGPENSIWLILAIYELGNI
jgi:hypothetical protein